MMIGNDSLLDFFPYGHGAAGLGRNPSCRKASCSSTSCRLRVIFECDNAISGYAIPSYASTTRLEASNSPRLRLRLITATYRCG